MESEEEKAKKLLYCSLCKVAVNSLSQLEAHNAGEEEKGDVRKYIWVLSFYSMFTFDIYYCRAASCILRGTHSYETKQANIYDCDE